MENFSHHLLNEVLANRKNNYNDNYEKMMEHESALRLQLSKKTSSIIESLLNNVIPINPSLSIKPRFKHFLNPKLFYQSVINNFSNMALLYDLLNDSSSKNLLIKLLAYRILGFRKVKLPRNTPDYWNTIKRMEDLTCNDSTTIPGEYSKFNLPILDLSPLGYQIRVNLAPQAAAFIFSQHQYEYHGKDFICKAEKGDVVFDAGACWGETSLYFAHEVGDAGKVFSFEFIPNNLKILKINLNHNPHLARQIQIIEHPIWNVSNEKLYYADHGPGSSISSTVTDQSPSQICKTISIDDVVRLHNLNTVDFIKMDIEGSELKALYGAINTIKKFRPKLAISVYHKPDDFITIPKFLNDLKTEYEFYLEHHTIHVWETVLFAVPKNR